MDDKPPLPLNFSLWAATFEGGIAVVAIVLGWLLGMPPLATLSPDWPAVGLALVATIPPLVLLAICIRVPIPPFSGVMRAVDDLLVPLFAKCSLIEIAAISVLAGLGEEMLFRGVLQAALSDWLGRIPPHWGGTVLGHAPSQWVALALVTIFFGLLHAVNASYAVLAAAIGLYLGWLWMCTGNLMVPATVHAVYDFLAMVYLCRFGGPRVSVKE